MTAAMSEDGFYRRLIDHAAQPVFSVDRHSIITSWNKSAEQILGIPAAEALGKPATILAEHRAEALGHAVRQALEQNVSAVFEDERPGPYGGQMKLAFAFAPIYDDAGKCIGASGLVRDITIREKLRDELGRAERLAGLGQLAGGMAHHFNNLLCGMTTRIEFALESGNSRQMEKALRSAAEAAARMAEITDALLVFARPGQTAPEPVRLDELVRSLVERRRGELVENGVTVDFEAADVPPIRLPRAQIEQVVGGLLNNAVEALAGRAGRVRMALRAEGDKVKLEVGDNGPGIDPEIIGRIFDPFFTSKGAFAGGAGSHAGLGLAVAHAVVTRAGGKIDVQSRPGLGATFTITLPLKPPEE
jgi:two-component system sensor histidine kinase PilS (NtrC family)